MQNFDDFENFSSNQNLKEVFQHVFELGKLDDAGENVAPKDGVHIEDMTRAMREIRDFEEQLPEEEAEEAAAPGEDEEAAETLAPEDEEMPGEAEETAAMREIPPQRIQPPRPQPPRPEPPRPQPPRPQPPRPEPPRPEPPRPQPPRPQPPRPEPPRPQPPMCNCPIPERELREFYFRVQQLYFILERNLDGGYGKERMRGLCELAVRILRLVKQRHARCYGTALSYHFDERAGDSGRARALTNELIVDTLGFIERCDGERDRDLLLIFLLLSAISQQLPSR